MQVFWEKGLVRVEGHQLAVKLMAFLFRMEVHAQSVSSAQQQQQLPLPPPPSQSLPPPPSTFGSVEEALA
eukprot:scaffold319954_cov18-Tisochrysis_lutea.AAC.1